MIYYNLSKTQLEAIADKLNYEFDSERLEIPKPLDPYDLVDHIGAKTDWIYITPTQSVLGLVAFDDMTWYAWRQPYYEKGMIPQVIFVPKGTILIDRTVVDSDERERERFIVIHECFHYLIHPKCFRISDGMGQYCKKESFNPWAKERSKMTALEIIEYQANYCAAAFLMPKTAVSKAFIGSIKMKSIPEKPLKYERWLNPHIVKLSKTFGVNFNPMKYRLQQLNLIASDK